MRNPGQSFRAHAGGMRTPSHECIGCPIHINGAELYRMPNSYAAGRWGVRTVTISEERIRRTVRKTYGAIAKGDAACCDPSCCAPGGDRMNAATGDALGPRLGVGEPVAAADLRTGETVLDLGSGAGGDVFRAAERVGPSGRAIGVDMTPEMVSLSREAAGRRGTPNVEFRLGEIEHLPVEDAAVDVVVSDCVINLSPDKPQVFREAFRVLRPGGRIVISDLVVAEDLPDERRQSPDAWAACIAGAVREEDYARGLSEAGFVDVRVRERRRGGSPAPFPVTIEARKSG